MAVIKNCEKNKAQKLQEIMSQLQDAELQFHKQKSQLKEIRLQLRRIWIKINK